MTLTPRLPIVLGFLVASGACGRSPAVVESDSAGIRIIESTAPAWPEAERWRLSPTPFLAIGAAEGSEAEQLFGVEDVDRLGDGRLVITNQGTHELRVYSPAGEYLGSIGREGEGPGEFMYPSQTWVGDGDSLFVRAFQRLVVFDGTGAFARSVMLSAWPPQDRFLDGTFLFVVIPPGLDQIDPAYVHPVNALVRAEADGTEADTLAYVPGTEMYRFSPSAGGVASFYAPFGSVRLAATSGNSVVTAGGIALEIRHLDEDGSLARIIRPRVGPSPVTGTDIAALEQRMLDASPARTHPDRRRLFQAWTYPEYKAALDELLVDSEGNVWARRYHDSTTDLAGWSVFDVSGQWLGEVEVPAGLQVAEIGPDYLIGVWTDELGVEYVRLYTLEKP